MTPFGGAPDYYQGLLGADETAALQKRAQVQGLLGAGINLAAGMNPYGPRRTALQNILSAVGGGFQAAGGAYEGALKNYQTQQEIQKAKMAQEQAAIQAQQQQAKNIVLQKMQMGQPLTQSDYAILNPEEYAKTQYAADIAARARGIPSQQQQPQQQQVNQQVQEQPVSGTEKQLEPVPVIAKPDFSQKIDEAERAAQFYANMGTKESLELSAKSRDEAEYYRKLQRQDQAVESSTTGLNNIHPTLLPRVQALKARASTNALTPDQIISEQNSILKDDSQIRETLSQDVFNNKLKLSAAQGGILYETPEKKFERSSGLRKEYQGIPVVKDFDQVKVAYNQINGALKNPSPANDLAAATKFMKLLDPGSVVRESELGMAMAATGAIDKVSSYYDRLKSGEKLTPQQREDFRKSAEMLYKASENVVIPIQNEYRGIAADSGVNPRHVIIETPSAIPTSQQGTEQAAPKKPSGVIVRKIRD